MSLETKVDRYKESGFVVDAMLGSDIVGSYKVFLHSPNSNIAEGELESQRSGLGVCRTLISIAVLELKRLSTELGRPIRHNVWFGNTDNYQRLAHLFFDKDYQQLVFNKVLYRVYTPCVL